jgi:hypothetical protein
MMVFRRGVLEGRSQMEVRTSKQRVAASRGVGRAVRTCALAVAVLALPFAIPSAADAQDAVDPVKELAAPPSIQLPLKPSPEFAQFPRYVGMLGKRQIVMRLGPKTDDPSGVHGEYQFTDTGEVILIAGDREGTTLEAEESNDGTHITGNWVGTFGTDGTVSGERMEVDDSNPVDFELKPLAAGLPVPAPTSPAQPAPAAANGKTVNGVSNLTIGE